MSITDKELYGAEELYVRIAGRKTALEKVIIQKKKDLKKYPRELPEGTISIGMHGRNHTTEQYSIRNGAVGKPEQYLKKTPENRKIVTAMIQREYDRKVLKAAEREYRYLARGKQFLAGDPLLRIADSMGRVKQKWITPVLLNDQKFAEEWKKNLNPESQYRAEERLLVTKQQEYVRSKSELLIANMLHDYGIPYGYECALKNHGRTWALPDFTVLNIRKKKEYYWEHFGMMGDQQYSRKALQKIKEYEKHNIFQGAEIIYTFESPDCPFDPDNIERLIRKFLI